MSVSVPESPPSPRIVSQSQPLNSLHLAPSMDLIRQDNTNGYFPSDAHGSLNIVQAKPVFAIIYFLSRLRKHTLKSSQISRSESHRGHAHCEQVRDGQAIGRSGLRVSLSLVPMTTPCSESTVMD